MSHPGTDEWEVCGRQWNDVYECKQPFDGPLAMNHLCFQHLVEQDGPLRDEHGNPMIQEPNNVSEPCGTELS